jgi:hypothetical protein
MTKTKSLIAAALALAAITTTSACTANDPKPSPSTTTSATSTATTPTPSSTSLSPAEKDAKDAAQTITRFWAVLDELAADPKKSLDSLAAVSRDPSITTWRQLLTRHRVRQEKQIGETVVVETSVKPSSASRFVVAACIDVSKVDLVDKDGKSIVAANRPPRVQYQYIVDKVSDGVFYIVQDKAVQTC